ncbi:S8 family serine peptidase [Streptomyces sp. AcE210]|uniref:S8 family peptidase n=1 Tax=Streptomyces sp. AcE210 TaxID=2292703 RepID=UPI000E3019D5|nr:S8 family serine peptidase [Streptomyces sp. AcE210]RFC70830.1 peptidase [Streptomyces sp. AcE210]
MRPILRVATTMATATVLAASAALTGVGSPASALDGDRPLTGDATTGTGTATAVALITGDTVDVTTDVDGRTSAHLRPNEDGSAVDAVTEEQGGDQFVIPASALAGIQGGWLDKELFNVTGLIEQGYDDAHTASLPLITQYASAAAVPRSASAVTLPGKAKLVRALPTVRGAAVKVTKGEARGTWKDLASRSARSADHVSKVWLDAKVTSTMAESNAQIGTDAAWSAGVTGKGVKVAVLDTGIDASHPDFAGQIAASQDFTGSKYGTDDKQGHGTHTASTVAGTGAASDGKERGVAPDAQLLIGKVLNDSGSGSESMIISGMQWALDNGADVVSMSIGTSGASDCTDPIAQAAESLAAQDKALFVIAAGNIGTAESITSPGCAPSALTVGAVDADDETASFSSRGTVKNVHTTKPEIAAPGVGILAAHAGVHSGAGAYQRMSGTSMATPHVAGAAALLKQRHPDWDAVRLKEALVSAADSDIPGGVQETGAGRLDAAKAMKQTVVGPGAVSAGAFAWPQTAVDVKTVPVTYTNTADAPLTLSLKLGEVLGNDGTRTGSGLVRLGAGKLTVPAGGTADVPLTIKPTVGIQDAQYGDFGGRIEATASDGTTVTVPFGFYLEPKTVDVKVKLIGRDGKPQIPSAVLDIVGLDDATVASYYPATGEQDLRLRAGTYYINGVLPTRNAAGAVDTVNELAYPELKITKDTELVLDARKAREVTYTTDKPTETAAATLSYGRWWDANGSSWVHSGSISYAGVTHINTWGHSAARRGGFEAGSWFRAVKPGTGSASPYIYNLGVLDTDVIAPGRHSKVSDRDLAAVEQNWHSIGTGAAFLDTLDNYRPWNPTSAVGGSVLQPVTVPLTRTQYFSAGRNSGSWAESGTSTNEAMRGSARDFKRGERLKESWYKAVMRPTAALNRAGDRLLAGERQGNLIGFQSALFSDADGHFMYSPGFKDGGSLSLYKNGTKVFNRAYPYGVFQVTSEPADYVLEQYALRSYGNRTVKYPFATITRFRFRSGEEPDVASQTLPLVFPGYDAPVDSQNKTDAGPVRIKLSATGHGDYTPGDITAATVKYSYEGAVLNPAWIDAKVVHEDDTWYAEIDHSGASGKDVSLLVDLTTENGGSVQQQVINGYGVR